MNRISLLKILFILIGATTLSGHQAIASLPNPELLSFAKGVDHFTSGVSLKGKMPASYRELVPLFKQILKDQYIEKMGFQQHDLYAEQPEGVDIIYVVLHVKVELGKSIDQEIDKDIAIVHLKVGRRSHVKELHDHIYVNATEPQIFAFIHNDHDNFINKLRKNIERQLDQYLRPLICIHTTVEEYSCSSN